MKKISIFLLLAFVSSCSSTSDNSSNNSSNNASINPPAWIQGTWIQDGGTSAGYKFTQNDFSLISFNTTNSFANAVAQTKATGGNASVNETITSNSYNIDITIGAHTDSYYFNKISTTKIEWVNDPLGSLADLFYVKQ